jgi:hypothetical protein
MERLLAKRFLVCDVSSLIMTMESSGGKDRLQKTGKKRVIGDRLWVIGRNSGWNRWNR